MRTLQYPSTAAEMRASDLADLREYARSMNTWEESALNCGEDATGYADQRFRAEQEIWSRK